MSLKLVIPGCIRSKKNSKRIYATGRFKKVLPSKAYLLWEAGARASALEQIGRISPITDPIQINAQIYYKGPQPDLSGCLESIGDAFEGILWENDKQIESWDGSRLIHDKDNPRVELEVEPIAQLVRSENIE